MSTQDLTLLSAMLKKMDWLEERQKIIAQNISNADTPGYKPLDLKPLGFRELLGSSSSKHSLNPGAAPPAPSMDGVTTTAKPHIGAEAGTSKEHDATRQKQPYETAPAGNSVVIEEQLLKMSENYTDHSFVSNLYQRNINLIKSALK